MLWTHYYLTNKLNAMKLRVFYFTGMLLLSFLMTTCEKGDNLLVTKSKKDTQNTLKKGQITSIYWTETTNGFWVPATPPRPYKDIQPIAYWNIDNKKNKFVAHASISAYVEDHDACFGDPLEDNCYAEVQIFLVKNDRIWNGYSLYKRIDSLCDARSSLLDPHWEFSFSEDLEGVSIVAQGRVWGCFEYDSLNRQHKIYIAEDERSLFNLTPPPQSPPLPPENLTVSDIGSPLLSWETSTGADHYEIWRLYNHNWSLLGTASNTSYTDFSVMTRNPQYWFGYRVKAVNGSGSSNYSNDVYIQGETWQ